MPEEKERVEKKEPRNCLSEIDQSIANKLLLLQQKDIETYGFIKDAKLKNVRFGEDHSVGVQLMPKEQHCEFHTHPFEKSKDTELGDTELQNATEEVENACAKEGDHIRKSIISPNDALIQLQYRVPLGLTSVMVSTNKALQYILTDPEKFEEFKEKQIKPEYGTADEDDVESGVLKKWNQIFWTAVTDVYDVGQNVSQCGDKEVWMRVKKEWEAFLQSIGMTLTAKDIEYK